MDAEEPTNAGAGVNPGERLRAARERAGWTVEQVALRLRLSPSQVRALETGRRADLPPAAYVRGYLRSYAQLLGLDPQEFAKARASEEGGTPPPVLPTRVVEERKGGMGMVLYGLLLAGVVVGVVSWHERGRSQATIPSSQAAPAQVTGILPPRLTSLAATGTRHGNMRTFPLAVAGGQARPFLPPLQESVPSPLPGKPHRSQEKPAPKIVRSRRPVPRHVAPAGQVVARATQAATPAPSLPKPPPPSHRPRAPVVTATVAPPSAAVPNPGGLVSLPQDHTYVGLRIRANDGAVEVTVRDARGVRLVAGRIAAGRAVHVVGRAPFRLTLSQSQGVAVSIGGRAVTLPSAHAGQNVRVTVDP